MPRTDLSLLSAELEKWPADAGPATFWWRDDDASGPCNELDRLLAVADSCPLALATVPSYATEALSDRLATERNVTVFQHGWKHQNHSVHGSNSEYPPGRPPEIVAQEFSDGSARLTTLFGEQFAPVFTPPWHGLDESYLPLLRPAGIGGLSLKGRRRAVANAALVQNNVHCVPIEWSNPPRFGEPARYIGQIVDHLVQRRTGADREEATGILTHHLVQDQASLDFVRDLLNLIATHPNARLVDPAELFFGSQDGLSSVDLTIVRRSPSSPSTTV